MYAHTIHSDKGKAAQAPHAKREGEIILYDLPSQPPCECWSPNPWKARASLNYKGLPYKTEWVEYPDLAPKFKDLGIPKNDPSTSNAEYSSPTAKLPDGSYVMDSRKIAEALDKLQPEPSLHMDKTDIIDRTQKAVLAANGGLAPIGIPRVPEKLLNSKSATYFNETRSKRFGMPLPELAKSEKAGEAAWKAAQPHLEEIASILNENKEGPYVLGKEVSFSDFIIGGFWAFEKKLDENGDLFDRAMKFDKSFPVHYEAVKKWFEKKT